MRSARSRCAPRCPCYCPARPSPRTRCSAATTPSRLLACHDRPPRLRPDHRHLLCGPAVPPPDPQARHHRRQVTPSIWTACHTARPNGVSTGTWLLILGELSCWLAFGLHKSDPRLIILGTTGVTASALILA